MGRAAAEGKVFNRRSEGAKLDLRNHNLNSHYRRDRRDVADSRVHVAQGDGNHRAIIVVRNRAAVQPGVEGGANFRRADKQPDRQGQPRGRAMQLRAQPATDLADGTHLSCKSFAFYKNETAWQRLFHFLGP